MDQKAFFTVPFQLKEKKAYVLHKTALPTLNLHTVVYMKSRGHLALSIYSWPVKKPLQLY